MKTPNADAVTNCLSIDVEGFVESNVQSFHIGKQYIDRARENYEIEKNTTLFLELLSEFNVKATFFFLGRIARDVPIVVREVARSGHEIACHGFEHVRVSGMREHEFRELLISAKKGLEDVAGCKVFGFRAPDFSITESSLWALNVVREVGFFYDSSIYPIGLHDVYGIKGTEPVIHRLWNGLIEMPLPSIEVLGRRFPFGGGGYFRLYPLFLTKYCIALRNRRGHSCMFYVHPYEIGSEIPMISELSYYRKFRHYYNCSNGRRRLSAILGAFKFDTAIEILRERNLVESE